MAQALMALTMEQTYCQKLMQISDEKKKCKIWNREKYQEIVKLLTTEPSKEVKTPAYYYWMKK